MTVRPDDAADLRLTVSMGPGTEAWELVGIAVEQPAQEGVERSQTSGRNGQTRGLIRHKTACRLQCRKQAFRFAVRRGVIDNVDVIIVVDVVNVV